MTKRIMLIKFSDDRGTTEDTVDLDCLHREFFCLLRETLADSNLFSGPVGHLNLSPSVSGMYLHFK